MVIEDRAPPIAPFSPLVGRGEERDRLRRCLAAARDGRGGLLLISGDTGIGKTALAEQMLADGAALGFATAIAYCNTLSPRPPYAPWTDLCAALGDTPDAPSPFTDRASDRTDERTWEAALVVRLRDFLAAHAARRPLILLMDDLHWADDASLRVLHALTRPVATLAIIVVATYQPVTMVPERLLAHLIPSFARDPHTTGLTLGPLTEPDVRALAQARYRLAERDAARLVAFLSPRAEGNPLFVTEFFKALEAKRLLTQSDVGWTLGDLCAARIPLPLQLMIGSRLTVLSGETQRLLALAAIIGPEPPLALWCRVGMIAEDALLPVIEESVAARVLDEAPDGASVRFAHALIREAIYEQMSVMRRRLAHRQVAETLIAMGDPDADAVAFHFQRAGDARAARWLVAAGERLERTYAWLAAAERYEAALDRMARDDTDPHERGWLRLRLALMRRYSYPARALADLDDADALAQRCEEGALRAQILLFRGNLRCLMGDLARGLDELERGVRAVTAMPATAVTGWGERACGARTAANMLLSWRCHAGRFAEAQVLGDYLATQTPIGTSSSPPAVVHAQTVIGLAQLHAFLGRADAAHDAFTESATTLSAFGRYLSVGTVRMYQLLFATLAYRADRLAERRAVADAAEAAWERGSGARVEAPARFARAPLLVIEGAWTEARTLAHAGHTLETHHSLSRVVAAVTLTQLAHGQGDAALLRALLAEWLPQGPQTIPGTTFYALTMLQRVAAAAAMDADDLPQAQAWLRAHDHWLAWSGAVLGRSEGQALWAHYYRAAGDLARAQEHAQRARCDATQPRQPLALLAAHRLLGILATDAGDDAAAGDHLTSALALADACAAPYERALTLLVCAECALATGRPGEAAPLLDAARAICLPLGAHPAIARIDACYARIIAAPTRVAPPFGLTERELDIMRLVAEGLPNARVAQRLSISPSTVNSHLTRAYQKIGVDNRTAATRRFLDARP